MADEDVVDFMNWHVEARQLHLCALATVDEKVSVVNRHVVRGRKPPIGWHSRAGTEDGKT